jgi:glycosyltransferase involved in cell wall biosynthesis
MVQQKMKFSIVCPIKNEVDLIPMTLPSFYSIHPDEVILCLDKPAPEEVIKSIQRVVDILGVKKITRIIEVGRNPEYRYHQPLVRRTGFRAARNDAILTVDIDDRLDPKLRRYFGLLKGNVKMVSFAKFSATWRGALSRLIQRFFRRKSFTGLYLFSRSAWLETEDEESVKRLPTRSEDMHLHHYLTKKYDWVFVADAKNILVRPTETRKDQFLMGWSRWMMRRTPLWRVVISNIMYYRPHMLIGYLEAKWHHAKRL